jgi:hypothetical protein
LYQSLDVPAVARRGRSVHLAWRKLLQVRDGVAFEPLALTPPEAKALVQHIFKVDTHYPAALLVNAHKNAK